MNKEQLIAKIAAMKAQSAPITPVTVTPEPIPAAIPTEQSAPAKMVSFTILWHEGTGEFDNKTVTTWKEANKMMRKIYDSHEGQGYTKVKLCIKWENGAEITDRADCSDNIGDFGAGEIIGQYLKKQNSVMYQSNLNQGDRVNLQWEDQESPEPIPTATEENKTNLTEIPGTLKSLLGIVETIEESNDSSQTALIKASEQVERCKAYIVYLRSILPILEAKTEAMINAAHKPSPIQISNTKNYNLN